MGKSVTVTSEGHVQEIVMEGVAEENDWYERWHNMTYSAKRKPHVTTSPHPNSFNLGAYTKRLSGLRLYSEGIAEKINI
ncbi:hypothetical protein Pmani_028857 [Petrolisthes manimaculis]|uniref:Uncharacterized protein n=1 Tax=Petrolisthes manimaculis TaxID=1843537 RepID=A0AAE1NYR2_9EUCA|nr:hypothetical protein Pmani_028857 [Petrolisthes manimaculis]